MKDYSLFSISNSSGNFLFLQESMLTFGRDEIYISAELPSVFPRNGERHENPGP
jgi:hypothetical protein